MSSVKLIKAQEIFELLHIRIDKLTNLTEESIEDIFREKTSNRIQSYKCPTSNISRLTGANSSITSTLLCSECPFCITNRIFRGSLCSISRSYVNGILSIMNKTREQFGIELYNALMLYKQMLEKQNE